MAKACLLQKFVGIGICNTSMVAGTRHRPLLSPYRRRSVSLLSSVVLPSPYLFVQFLELQLPPSLLLCHKQFTGLEQRKSDVEQSTILR